MSQHDGVVADQDGASFLADVNAALLALFSNNSGATEPATMYAYQFWADTTTGIFKQRNAANTAWINKCNLADALAALAGSASQVFSVGTATAAAHALRLEQRQDPGRNVAINGDFSVSQINGTSLVTTGVATDTYVMDQHIVSAAGAAVTAGQSTDAAGLPTGFLYNLKISGAASNTNVTHKHRIEAKKAARLAGKRIAVSVWMYQDSGADMAGVTVKAFCPTTTADTFSALTQEGATQTINVVNGGAIAKYTAFITLGATNPKKGLEIDIDLNAALLAGKTCYIAAYQPEPVAADATVGTDFEFVDPEENLRRCQRFVPAWKSTGTSHILAQGDAASTTLMDFNLFFMTQTRVPITGIAGASVVTPSQLSQTFNANAVSAISIILSGDTAIRVRLTTSGLTAFQSGSIYFNSASGQIYGTGAQL